MSNSIIDKAADALEAEIAQAQALLTQMRAHSRGALAPAAAAPKKKSQPKKAKGTGPKKWTPEHRANFIKAMAKLKKDRKKAPATSAAQ
jgi:hypothetical protein